MARGREFKPVPTRVNQILDRASALVADAVRLSQTELIVRRDPADSTLMADPLKLEEALLNLVHNSIDAMRGSENRHLTLSAETAPPFVRIAVKDTGSGILPAHRERIFEPFFTTKGPEEGTGLGLAICKALVALHGGQIDVDSELGRGSTFTITLPLPANGAPPAR
jgi:signal transduction histidine kinase